TTSGSESRIHSPSTGRNASLSEIGPPPRHPVVKMHVTLSLQAPATSAMHGASQEIRDVRGKVRECAGTGQRELEQETRRNGARRGTERRHSGSPIPARPVGSPTPGKVVAARRAA